MTLPLDRDGRDFHARVEAYRTGLLNGEQIALETFLPSRSHPHYLSLLCELIIVDLRHRACTGSPVVWDAYQNRYPDLFENPELADRVIQEERRAREAQISHAADHRTDSAQWQSLDQILRSKSPGRGPALPTSPELDCAPTRVISYPDGMQQGSSLEDYLPFSESTDVSKQRDLRLPILEVGAELFGFRLIAELGSGSFGRVFLAHQGDLANRPVVLKITRDSYREGETLAQFQHTNIVPIYSVHQITPYYAVCMPYFGPTTLTDVLRELHRRGRVPTNGSIFGEVVRARNNQLPHKHTVPSWSSNGLQHLRQMSYVNAVLWLVSRLAEGLAHSHERGILHQDLKPANVLLTDEGEPMLLDFNLSEDIKRQRISHLAPRGGTLFYMAPEHLEIFLYNEHLVDERSDIYSLGVILYQLLTARLPFPLPNGSVSEMLPHMIARRYEAPRPLKQKNPQVTPAIEAIVRRCLAPDPEERYQSAQALYEDLQQQLHSRALKHTREPSIKERVRKWARRHPRIVSPGSLLFVALLFVAFAIAWGAWGAWKESREASAQAKQERVRAERQQEQARLRESEARQRESKAQQRDLALELLQLFQVEAESLGEMHGAISAARLLPDQEWISPQSLEESLRRCEAVLERYSILSCRDDWRSQPLVAALPPKAGEQFRKKVAEVIHLLVSARLHQPKCHSPWLGASALGMLTSHNAGAVLCPIEIALEQEHLRKLLVLNQQAAELRGMAPSSPALLLQRAQILERMARKEEAGALRERALKAPRTDLCDHYMVAWEMAKAERLAPAVSSLRQALQQAPEDFNLWLLLGICLERLAENEEAIEAYSACALLRPDLWWPCFQRGAIHMQLRRWKLAEEDFTQALQRSPRMAIAYLFRAQVKARQGLESAALSDFTRALKERPRWATALFLRGAHRGNTGDVTGAASDFARLEKITPASAEEWAYRGIALFSKAPGEALKDFNQALKQEPRLQVALYHKARLLTLELKRPQEAVSVLAVAMQYYPNHLDFIEKHAQLCARLGRIAEARAGAERLLRKSAAPHIYYHAAQIYARMGHYEPKEQARAIGLLRRAVQLGYGRQKLQVDPAFSSLHRNPAFQRLLKAVRALDQDNG